MTTIALITGANKGIGFATARLLGDRGWTILLGARDEVLGTRAEQELAAAGAETWSVQRHAAWRFALLLGLIEVPVLAASLPG